MKINHTIEKQSKAYEILFKIDNMLRVAMHNVMVEKTQVDYFNINTFPSFDFKSISTLDDADCRSGEPNFNVCLNFIGFDEKTRRYAKIRRSLDKILVDFMSDGLY